MDRPKKSSWRKRLSSSGVDEGLRSACSGLLLACDLCGVFCLPFPHWHLPSLEALSNPFIPWAIWAGRLWAPRKGDWLRLWLELTLAVVSEVALSPDCVFCCMACLAVLIAPACPLPDGSAGGGAVGHCDSISVSMSGTSTVGQIRCVTTFAFHVLTEDNTWLLPVYYLEADGSFSGYRSYMKGGKNLYKVKSLNSVYLNPWWR